MSHTPGSPAAPEQDSPRGRRGQWLAYAAAWAVFAFGNWRDFTRAELSVGQWWLEQRTDTWLTLVLLLLAPVAWRLRGSFVLSGPALAARIGRSWQRVVSAAAEGRRGSAARGAAWSLVAAAISLGMSIWIGRSVDRLPPAYHDEYSYLFQAKTFLAGRVSFPSHELAPLFDQMHVLNEGQFASRYFPGTGLWMAPFVALGHPIWGHWLAGTICAGLMFWIGRELAGDFAGMLAGLLTAFCPALALFSNLLLAHHPTLVGLCLFLLGFLRMTRLNSAGWAVVCGAGLAFAALCRPLTAASVALPFGVYLLFWAAAQRRHAGTADTLPRRIRLLGLLGVPLLIAGIGMFFYDRAITGSGWLTPYSQYTADYTPRHVYGFNNVVRGARVAGPRVVENYDLWAENLTAERAAANAGTRLAASTRWALGLVPLTMALVAGIVWRRQLSTGARLILAGIISLHVAHIPYWFAGIEEHHYVFEGAILWAAWTAAVTREVLRAWSSEGRTWMAVWWGLFLASTVAMNLSGDGGIWSAPLENGIRNVRFGRVKCARYLSLIEAGATRRPALVLIDPDPADFHMSWIINDPDLSGPLLLGRFLPERVPMARVRELFPGRTLYLFDVRENDFRRLE